MMRKVIGALASLVLASLAVPAEAARTLYTYTSVQDDLSFTFVTADSFPTFTPVSVQSATCLYKKAFCENLTVFDAVTDTQVTFRDGNVTRQVAMYPNNVFKNEDFQVATRTLSDSDVVYSYADTAGVYLTFVNNGYIKGSLGNFSAQACQVKDTICVTASHFSFDGYSMLGGTYDGVNGVAGLMFGSALLTQPGNHTMRAGSVSARLAVVGSAASAVPEPATWAMVIVGLAAVGLNMRLRPFARTIRIRS